MTNPSYRLSRFHQGLIYLACFFLFGSGVGWMLAHSFLHGNNVYVSAPHPSEPIWLAIHGLFAILVLILLGSLIASHMRLAWKAKKNRPSGAIFLGLNLLLITTGYGLYYAGSESLRSFFHTTHCWAGLVFPVAFGAHLWLAKKK